MMKVELLTDGSQDCPLIRLYEYQEAELEFLRAASRELASGLRVEFNLNEQPWMEAIDGIRFTWRVAAKDVGVILPASRGEFVLEFSEEAWREVEGKLSTLVARGGFNWLTNEGDVRVLISNAGTW